MPDKPKPETARTYFVNKVLRRYWERRWEEEAAEKTFIKQSIKRDGDIMTTREETVQNLWANTLHTCLNSQLNFDTGASIDAAMEGSVNAANKAVASFNVTFARGEETEG